MIRIPTSMTLTREQIARLDAVAVQVERSRSWVVSQAIDQYLSRAESDRPKGWTEADEEESIRIAGDALAEGAAS